MTWIVFPVGNFYASLAAVVFLVSSTVSFTLSALSLLVHFPAIQVLLSILLFFPFTSICPVIRRVSFDVLFFPSSYPPPAHLPPPLSLVPGTCQVSGPLLFPSLLPKEEMKFAPLTKGTKAESPCQSYKDSIFSFQGVLILKGKKKITASSPSPRCAFSAFWAASISWGTAR